MARAEDVSWSTVVTSSAWTDNLLPVYTSLRDQFRAAAEKHRKEPAVVQECLDRAAWLTSLIEQPGKALQEMEQVVYNHLNDPNAEPEILKEAQAGGTGWVERTYRRIVGMLG